MRGARVNPALLLALAGLVLLALAAHGSSAAPAIEAGGVFSRLTRRIPKTTLTTVAPPKDTRLSGKPAGGARLLKSRAATTVPASPKPPGVEALRQRLDETVEKVRARSKELKMEQEQKRVDRKLRRDQKKLERDQPRPAPAKSPAPAPAASVNPHNLQMPDCPAGKVYNGRRCVPAGKLAKH